MGIAFDEQHLSRFCEPPVARELRTGKPISHWGQAIVGAIEGIDNAPRIPACSIIVLSKIVAVRRCIDDEYVFNHVSLPPLSSVSRKASGRSPRLLSCGLNTIRLMHLCWSGPKTPSYQRVTLGRS